MANESDSPDRSDFERLYERLMTPDEEMDAASAVELLEEEGIDRGALVAGLRARLAREVERLEAEAEPVPQAMRDALEGLNATATRDDEPASEVDPEAWVGALLYDVSAPPPGDGSGSNHLRSFRERSTSLSPQDEEILRDLAAELERDEEG